MRAVALAVSPFAPASVTAASWASPAMLFVRSPPGLDTRRLEKSSAVSGVITLVDAATVVHVVGEGLHLPSARRG